MELKLKFAEKEIAVGNGRALGTLHLDVVEGRSRNQDAKLVAKGEHHEQVIVDLPVGAAPVVAHGAVPRAELHAGASVHRALRRAIGVGAVRAGSLQRCQTPRGIALAARFHAPG